MKSIPLYNRARRDLMTIVDDEDYERFGHLRWWRSSKGYATRSYTVGGREIYVSLHRELMAPSVGLVVDHINHDKLNNTRANLRLLTQQTNLMNRTMFRNNTTGFKGVTYQKGFWRARIQKDEQDIHLGYWHDLKSAALAYDCAAVLLFGADVVWRNLPDQPIPDAIYQIVIDYLTTALVQVPA